jgi:hypothetical protein
MFVIGLLIGVFLGVMVMCAFAIASEEPTQELLP